MKNLYSYTYYKDCNGVFKCITIYVLAPLLGYAYMYIRKHLGKDISHRWIKLEASWSFNYHKDALV